MTAERFKLAPLSTATTWPTLYTGLRDVAERTRGGRLTNREAVAVVTGFKTASNGHRWPIWYQFAALAYGWDTEHDKLDVSRARADALYPASATRELWTSLQHLAAELDALKIEPRLSLDKDDFFDVVVHGALRDALKQDGALGELEQKTNAPTRPSSSSSSVVKSRKKSSAVPILLAVAGAFLLFGRKRKPLARRARRTRKARTYAAS